MVSAEEDKRTGVYDSIILYWLNKEVSSRKVTFEQVPGFHEEGSPANTWGRTLQAERRAGTVTLMWDVIGLF